MAGITPPVEMESEMKNSAPEMILLAGTKKSAPTKVKAPVKAEPFNPSADNRIEHSFPRPKNWSIRGIVKARTIFE